MRDNHTSQPANEYDSNIRKTMPYYDGFHDSIISLVEVFKPHPCTWLDTGSGTGIFVQKAYRHFSNTAFTLADPSQAMLDIAKEKLATTTKCRYLTLGTEKLDFPSKSFDVITAILVHHYLDFETRRQATINCFRMLNEAGIYVTFETVLPRTEQGKQIGLRWWRQAQLKQGKDEVAIEKHLNRLGQEFFPISTSDHIELLQEAGFSTVEVLWASGMQVGFYAIK